MGVGESWLRIEADRSLGFLGSSFKRQKANNTSHTIALTLLSNEAMRSAQLKVDTPPKAEEKQ